MVDSIAVSIFVVILVELTNTDSICQFNQYNNKYWDGCAVYKKHPLFWAVGGDLIAKNYIDTFSEEKKLPKQFVAGGWPSQIDFDTFYSFFQIVYLVLDLY